MKTRFAVRAALLIVVGAAVLHGRADPPQERPKGGKEGPDAVAPEREELPGTLDGMIAVAIRSNPDVLRAEAKLIQAQTALNQARLRTTEEVISTAHERDRVERMLSVAEAAHNGARRRVEMGVASTEELVQVEAGIIDAKAKLEQTRARLRYLLGLGGEKSLRSLGNSGWDPARGGERKRADFSPKQKAMLEKKVRMEGSTIKVKEFLEKATGETVVAGSPLDALELLVPKTKEAEVPLRTALELLADAGGIVFVFRDYGILLTSHEVARRTIAPTIPEDSPLDPN